jgi:hypothetical protein
MEPNRFKLILMMLIYSLKTYQKEKCRNSTLLQKACPEVNSELSICSCILNQIQVPDILNSKSYSHFYCLGNSK